MPRANARVKVACRLCHDRRVKCDRNEGTACSNCRAAGCNCEPIVSRRGRTRKLPIKSINTEQTRRLPQSFQNVASNTSRHDDAQGDRNEHPKEPFFPALGPSGKTPYIGDSSNLNYLIQQFGNPFRVTTDTRPLEDHLHGAMLARLGSSTAQHMERLHTSAVQSLLNEGVFDLPPTEISDSLVDVYFQYSFPSLPVLDRSAFLAAREEGTVSRLLLNAVYLAASIYCSDSLVAAAGFASRYEASLTFYRRTKSLYDAGYEADSIAIIQATFLASHWWSGLLDHKDPWYWLGISAGMAQAVGMHQAKSYGRLQPRDRKLWRRLWWMVYAMDINLSMLLDRPPRVQGRLCDVAPLSEADFDLVSGLLERDCLGGTQREQSLFVVYAVQLAQTVDGHYTIKLGNSNGLAQDRCLEEISLWSSSLPPELQFSSANGNVWGTLIQILYHEYRLLLHRSNPRFSQSTGPGTPTFQICTHIASMLEFLVTSDLIYAAAATILPAVLSTLSIHIVNIHKGDTGARLISEHRARFCMLILDKLQDRWPVVASFYPIFDSLLKRCSIDVPIHHDTVGPELQEAGSSMGKISHGPCNNNNDSILDGHNDSFNPILQDNMNTTFPFSSFTNIFEDVFLSLPPLQSELLHGGDAFLQ
ncbi:hypothetical protein ASPWEDRAFT_121776 [Aspergillus wentii DTO 134E9]|uniref:Zn(2)-C6 fungal-type domain-containing protein n=1 Tax=Aspergillus wentii DTO 134E9 TaxID=1073089 RepID=A0A1L9R417_ASPWE|nr:uncharacterized protein ASPWEDRAFT_121776 [Aspergillus wentii DTO 134E9]OJJ29669.1 hypothetical protein ASPWEDRAFT_121776 [Aspergillus wentii DTO 134E9]